MSLMQKLDLDKPQDAKVITLKWLIILHVALIAFVFLVHWVLTGMDNTF